jgi:iron(II)-dependent oxidoreductase
MKRSRSVFALIAGLLVLVFSTACSALATPAPQVEVQVVTATEPPATPEPEVLIITATSAPTEVIAATQAPAITEEPATQEPATAEPPASGELGMAGNPVVSNGQWIPVKERMGGVEWVLVPAGCFTMGNRDGFTEETPENEVCFDNPYWMTTTEITNEQYGSQGPWAGDDLPRADVTWNQATQYCEGLGARLPNEAEWEYAARGPNGFLYTMGDTLQAGFVVHGGNSSSPVIVGSQPQGASWVGAVDMLGNVREWISSGWENYPFDTEDGRERPPSAGETRRVVRGGSYQTGASTLRASFREFYDAGSSTIDIGFRCAMDYQP